MMERTDLLNNSITFRSNFPMVPARIAKGIVSDCKIWFTLSGLKLTFVKLIFPKDLFQNFYNNLPLMSDISI